MKQTKRLVAMILAIVIVANLIALPVSNKPRIQTQVVLKPIQPKITVQPSQPTTPNPPKTEQIIRTFRVTAYTAIDAGMRGDGITKSGVKATPYVTVAASTEYPFGTILEDVETHKQYIVQDRGGAIRGNNLDLYVGHSNRKEAFDYGVQFRTFIVKFPKED